MHGPAAIVHSPAYRADIGPHVFPMEKYARVRERLVAAGWVREDAILAPEPATDEELGRVHDREYLDDLAAARWTPRTASSELPLSHEIVAAWRLMCGGTVLTARLALERGVAVHLGGGFHHAFAGRAEGFCYLNDLAVAVRAMQAEGRVERVAVVDVDLHQGNGTARIFQGDPGVFTFSIHQQHLYPIKERGSLDIGLDYETGDDLYLERLAGGLEAVWAHAPGLVLMQAGADPFEDDQLGALRLTFAGLERRDRMVIGGCATRGIPVAVTLGGGYARRLDDLVAIHTRTCQVALERGAAGGRAA
jgi:acetoin utilization deacetylase AcuC-like enzyme